MKTSTGIGTLTAFFPPSGRGLCPLEGRLDGIGKWGKRALIGFGIVATILWAPASSADDPVGRALSLVSQKKYSEARALLQPLLQREPSAPRVLLIHGILLAREGNAREAIAIFQRLRNDGSDMFEPYNNLAVLYAEQGRLDEAREVLIAALERRRDAVAYANLGDVYMRLADRAYSRARDIVSDVSSVSQRSRASRPGFLASGKPVERSASGTAKGGTKRPDMRTRIAPKMKLTEPAPGHPATPMKPPAAANDGLLVLVEDPEKAGPSKSAVALGGACVLAGKFKDRKAAGKVVEWMQLRGAEVVDLHHKKKRIVKSYRVYLPVFQSTEAAAAQLVELRGLGIRDVVVLRKGARANEISLGVFKSKNNTQRRVAALEKLGYSAKWAANTKTLSEYTVRARTGETRSAFGSAWRSKFPGHSVEVVDCP